MNELIAKTNKEQQENIEKLRKDHEKDLLNKDQSIKDLE